jgi:hypothetical protein
VPASIHRPLPLPKVAPGTLAYEARLLGRYGFHAGVGKSTAAKDSTLGLPLVLFRETNVQGKVEWCMVRAATIA